MITTPCDALLAALDDDPGDQLALCALIDFIQEFPEQSPHRDLLPTLQWMRRARRWPERHAFTGYQLWFRWTPNTRHAFISPHSLPLAIWFNLPPVTWPTTRSRPTFLDYPCYLAAMLDLHIALGCLQDLISYPEKMQPPPASCDHSVHPFTL